MPLSVRPAVLYLQLLNVLSIKFISEKLWGFFLPDPYTQFEMRELSYIPPFSVCVCLNLSPVRDKLLQADGSLTVIRKKNPLFSDYAFSDLTH